MAKRDRDPMTEALARFRDPTRTGWEDAWVGLEPTFQSRKSVKKWARMSALGEAGEDAYFEDAYMLGMEKKVARTIERRFRSGKAKGLPSCMFDRVDRDLELDQWKVERQNLKFRWADRKLAELEVRFALDPETFEYSIKPVPLVWFYDERWLAFLEDVIWRAPARHGLAPSVAHGGAQFSFSAKTFLSGSLLADDITDRLNHPELSLWIMDWPNPDDRAFRATRARLGAFQTILGEYWAGAFHARATGGLTAENALLDRGFEPAPSPPKGLMDPRDGPKGSSREVFQTNFAFGRAVRLRAQNVHPGYWQAAHPEEKGYRPDQIMRYSEANLNRLQIAGELHVKSGTVLDPERVPELDAPLDASMLATEASWEDRAQMGRTSARDFVEALLLDAHHARYRQSHPHPSVIPSLLQDQLLADGEETVKKHAGARALARLQAQARKDNLDAGRGRIRSAWIEPETLMWAAWRALPAGERAAIAREAVLGFVERVENAASADPRAQKGDPMGWHRHRVHPSLWRALDEGGKGGKAGDRALAELAAWRREEKDYLARRPIFSHVKMKPPWPE